MASVYREKFLARKHRWCSASLRLPLNEFLKVINRFVSYFFYFFLFIPSHKVMKVQVLLVCVNPARAIKAGTLKRLFVQRCSAKEIGNSWKK